MATRHEISQSAGRNHIFYLAKFFEKEKHAIDFMSGQLYLNKLSFFKGLEDNNSGNRGDKHEGTIVWGQPGKIRIEINGHDMSDDLAGPASLSSNRLDEFNVLCLYAACVRNLTEEIPRDLSEIRNHVLIPKKCEQLGRFAIVIRNGPEFLNRVTSSAKLNSYQEVHGLVKYYDPSSFSGNFPGISGAFMKQEIHRYQSEYRIVLQTGKIGSGALILDIGNISDIAMLTTIPAINRSLEVRHTE